MNPSDFAALMLAGVVAFFCAEAQAAPLRGELSPGLSLVVQAGFNCGLVNGKFVCGDTKGHHKHRADDDDDDTDHHKKKGKGKKDEDDESGLTQCTIQQSNGGGGCVTGFKHVCEKLKNGKKCCGCVPDKNAPAQTGEKIEDNPCFGLCSNTCGGATQDARNACILDCVQTTNCSPH